MANTHARRRRRRRTNWQAVFWMLILGIVIGVILGIWLCANYDVLGVIDRSKTGTKFDGGQQAIETYPPVIATMYPTAAPEPTAEPTPVIIAPTEEPTPEPAEPTPVPAEPTAVPAEPTPEPAEPTPEPVEPTPEPVEPTPEPVVVVTPSPATQANGGFGLSSSYGEGGDEVADEVPDPVMTDENGNAVTKEEYVAQGGTVAEEPADEEPAGEQAVSEVQTAADEQAGEPAAEQTGGTAVAAEPRSRTNPVLPQEWFVFETEINDEGMPYYGKDGAGIVVPMAIRVADYMSPDDYAAKYADQYQLYGVEAAVVIEIRNDSASAIIVPDNALGIVLRDKSDIPNDTYPLADAPMKASTDITIGPGETVTVYKRYALDKIEGPYPFLSVAYMAGGETLRTYFLLEGMQ